MLFHISETLAEETKERILTESRDYVEVLTVKFSAEASATLSTLDDVIPWQSIRALENQVWDASSFAFAEDILVHEMWIATANWK